ncbi:hypothetical protein LTR85_000595 [Meristemomyces frigidus]|nr:hypothetical protein LTR85_000595 [Meristemomyces frigidus]
MTNFTANLGRKLRGIYKTKSRSSRPEKLRDLRNEIDDAQMEPATPSQASIYTAMTAADGNHHQESNSELGSAGASLASPTEPGSVDLGTLGQDETTHGTTSSPGVIHHDEDVVLARSGSEQLPTECDPVLTEDSAAVERHIETVAEEGHGGPVEYEQQYGETEAEFVDEQTIRQQAYIFIEPEEAEDYTDGPPRMVLAADGIKQCPALLMTFDLSAKLQRALRAQRDFARAEIRALSQV